MIECASQVRKIQRILNFGIIRINLARERLRRLRGVVSDSSRSDLGPAHDVRGPVLMHAGKVSARRGRSAHICVDRDYASVLSLFFCPFIFFDPR